MREISGGFRRCDALTELFHRPKSMQNASGSRGRVDERSRCARGEGTRSRPEGAPTKSLPLPTRGERDGVRGKRERDDERSRYAIETKTQSRPEGAPTSCRAGLGPPLFLADILVSGRVGLGPPLFLADILVSGRVGFSPPLFLADVFGGR